MSKELKTVGIIGGGLVGSMAAVFWAKRGYQVCVFESRQDVRLDTKYEGRSINLALSRRGIASLERVGWRQKAIDNGIPMYARLVHSMNGDITPIPYGLHGEAILSVDRRKMNEDLLNVASKLENVQFFFEHKCDYIDFEKREVTFELPNSEKKKVKLDLIVGTDGVYSAVRKFLMRKVRMDYSQHYIGHGYKELTIRPTAEGEYRLSNKGLHIWPRHSFMMIALPNKDKTFTCTLFMPFEKFDEIKTTDQIMSFFEKEFPDFIPLIGQENLVNDYLRNPVGPLLSVKCTPYHYDDFCVIMGDAAHAMVPFYGQGMNCGFQDVLVLDQLLDKHKDNIEASFEEYTKTRNPDAEAICDLAIHNYTEMRHDVTSTAFLIRKQIVNVLSRIFPKIFTPLYTMVAFTEIPYSEVMRKWQQQERYLDLATSVLKWTPLLALGGFGIWRYQLLEKFMN
jgi:kynurenine 3-monooxygenase